MKCCFGGAYLYKGLLPAIYVIPAALLLLVQLALSSPGNLLRSSNFLEISWKLLSNAAQAGMVDAYAYLDQLCSGSTRTGVEVLSCYSC